MLQLDDHQQEAFLSELCLSSHIRWNSQPNAQRQSKSTLPARISWRHGITEFSGRSPGLGPAVFSALPIIGLSDSRVAFLVDHRCHALPVLAL